MDSYRTLNDAAVKYNLLPELAEGNTKIWYLNRFWRRTFCEGFTVAKSEGCLATRHSVAVTHVCIGSIACTDLQSIYTVMQAAVWSPNGEARHLIERAAVEHTSMIKGDVIQIGDKFFMVDRHFDFVELE